VGKTYLRKKDKKEKPTMGIVLKKHFEWKGRGKGETFWNLGI